MEDLLLLSHFAYLSVGKMTATMLNGGAGIDLFDYVTIAGACMGIYKSLFLKEKHEAEVNQNKSGETSTYQTKYLNGQSSILFDDDWISVSKLDRKFVIGPTPFAESCGKHFL
jgi:hypothetical protein